MFAVFVMVVGLVAGAYMGVQHSSTPDTTQASQYVGDPVDPVENLQKRHEAADSYRQGQLRADANRRASRSAERKAAAGGDYAAAVAQDADAAKKEAEKKASGAEAGGQPVGPVPSSCKEFSGNKATGCTLLLQEGFKIDQMTCLSKLWDRESGWNEHASNPSGAYGIPQALPGNKMAAYGSDWQENPATQIKWGLNYIEGRYSSPCDAWAHSENNGWY
ncbi:MAG: transglycosylase SLT domain-containing protein [Actinocatenispora sp.]